ncbi:uncharacterized protein LOC110985869 [Acanthaster planci]|uniref:Uncharacterized protein LOC110985869 n=1 Tax=Acanthaster planci TaxID=133434 RepID=A0A8B7ZBH0_ACAPL|nr:uncharacterized protein LOC110985869 [Acanthaster planci]
MLIDVACILRAALAIILLRLMSCAKSMECFYCPATSSEDECRRVGRVQRCTVGYNTCFTQIKYKGGSDYLPMTVTRSCVDDTFCTAEKKTFNNGQCIASDTDYTCVWCCHEDNCNLLSSASRLNVNPISLLGGIAMATYLSTAVMWHR